MNQADPLDLFLPPVREWFRRTLGEPTAVQREGWPVIASGQTALLLAPTGSGKTLAAFLACLDGLWRQSPSRPGVQVLYISPLKALNNDIHRNLQLPLTGVAEAAAAMGLSLPRIETAIRTGDTPAAERQRLVRHPPQVLITTPESLHLILTSKAREILRGVTHCIVDEIHALCPNKRGVFLALLLERLRALIGRDFARIGLSATQRPLSEVARYLGGYAPDAGGRWQERPVAIVDAGLRKHLDLQVISPVDHFGPLPEKSIWPSIYRRLAEEIRTHRSTIVFANNRRSVERLTAMLNECLAEDGEAREEIAVRAHHGSVSLETRRQTELALKEGRLRAVVATASLELGIDMGAVDLVCQVESTGNVARALQRVGRAGHLVGQSSKGRLIPKTLPDLLNQAVLASEMAAGHVEELRVPLNCLDVLAQQIIAMTAVDDWKVNDIYALVRRAYSYHDLSPAAFDSVLEMVAGRFRFAATNSESTAKLGLSPTQHLNALQPRIHWDRVHQKLHALPGSQRLAVVHGGTIPDTGQYAVYNPSGARIGEVDEEFVYERRIGDAFLLGTSAWRIDRIETDRVLVSPAEGIPAMVPFWRGENTGRSYDLGLAQGQFLRNVSKRLDDTDCLDWLTQSHLLDTASASNLRDYVRRQLVRTKVLPTDRTLLIEASRDPLGDWQVILHCPFGRAMNLGLRLAMENRLRTRLGYRPQCLHHDDGILLRLTESDEPVLDLFEGITADNVREMVLEELADSALFALRFRQNAARALMMPRGAGGKRSPLWLQRLRGHDLLQVARQYPDFPIVVETFRECLHDHLDLPRLQELLGGVAFGTIEFRTVRLDSPSPFAAGLLFAFTATFMYQYDDVESSGVASSKPLDEALLDQLIGGMSGSLSIDARAVGTVDRRLRGLGRPPRTKPEMAEWLRRMGDAAEDELEGPMAQFLTELEQDGVATQIQLANVDSPKRWILVEEAESYRLAFASSARTNDHSQSAAASILQRFLNTHALVGLDDVLARYPFDRHWAEQQLEQWTRQGRLVQIVSEDVKSLQWSAPENYEQVQRGSLAVLRHEVITCPTSQFVDFLFRWQHLHPDARIQSPDDLSETLRCLQWCELPIWLWDQVVLLLRCHGFHRRHLDAQISSGSWIWHCALAPDLDTSVVAFMERESLAKVTAPRIADSELNQTATVVLDALRRGGAMYTDGIATSARLTSSATRSALWSLLRRGIVTNDVLDVARRGEPPSDDNAPLLQSRAELRSFLRDSRRRRENVPVEGRWSLIPWDQPDAETSAMHQTWLLLHRFGILTRDLCIQAGSSLPWRIHYEVLSRMELAGEVRRGYFVEGLSGAQFALPDAARMLRDSHLPSMATAPCILVHSLDPANLFGSGAALSLDTQFGDDRQFPRRLSNWLIVKNGRPVLAVEQNGKRLTALPSASNNDLRMSVERLSDLLDLLPGESMRRMVTVEAWNGNPVTSSDGKELLEQAGFVRDYRAMTLYPSRHALP